MGEQNLRRHRCAIVGSYVPKQYDDKEPACVMVFQDGGGYQNPKGTYRAPTVMDNLIHKKQIPVMIGIFD